MDIWFKDVTLEELNTVSQNTMVDHVGIEFIKIGPDYLKAKMPVDYRTKQPIGTLHGGASAVLAESLGSAAATLCLDMEKQYCVGLHIDVDHVRAVEEGFVIGIASPIHIGRKIQVWEIKIYNEQDKLVSISRLTLMVLEK